MSKKICTGKCGQEKELTEFYIRSPKRGGGYEPQCKKCCVDRQKQYSGRRRKYEVQSLGEKVCKECGHCKDLSAFGIDRWKKDGRQILCRPCKNMANKKVKRIQSITNNGGLLYKPTHPDKYDTTVEYSSQQCEVCYKVFEKMRKAHTRCDICTILVGNILSHLGHDRQLPITVTAAITVARTHMYALVCYYCARPFSDKYGIESGKSLDHILPVCAGGTNDPSNIAVCHLSCNRAKGTLSVEDFVTLCSDIVSHMTGKTSIPLSAPIPPAKPLSISPRLRAYLTAYYVYNPLLDAVTTKILPGDDPTDSEPLQSKNGLCKIKGEKIPLDEIKNLLIAA